MAMVVHLCNPKPLKNDHKFQDSLGYIAKHSFQKREVEQTS